MNSPDLENTETSLEDDLRAAFAAAEAAQPDDGEAPIAALEADDHVVIEVPTDASRERDESGRFKAKVEAAEPLPVPENDGGTASLEADRVIPDPYGLAPQYAGPAIKGKWAELPADVKEEIVKRDKEVHQTFTRFDEERNFGKQMREAIQPYEGLIKELGAEPKQAVSYLLNADATMRRGSPDQKADMLRRIAQDYQIDPFAAFGFPGGQQPAEMQVQRDPQVESLQQRIDRLERERNSDIESRREEDQRQINGQIESFASRPENVYFQRVAPVMAILLQNGQAGSLEEAYDKAVYADPETRALHLNAQRETEDRKRNADAASRAALARKASPSVTGAPGSAVPTSVTNGSSGSVEDDLRAAFQQHAGRA